MKKIELIERMVRDYCKVITDNYVDYHCLKDKLINKINRSWEKEMIVDNYNKYVVGELKIGQVIDRLVW